MKLKFSLPIAALACLGLAALLSTPKSARAQADPASPTTPAAGGRRRGGRAPGNPIATAFKSISPTADEQTKFDGLTTSYESAMTVARADTGADGRKKQAELRAKYKADVEALLTPDQATKFKQAAVVPGIMRNLETQLMLTDDEKTKIEPILNDYAVKSDGLTGAEARTMTTDMKTKIRAVLTPDQQTKLDAMRNLAGGGGGGRRGGAGAATPPVTPPAATPPVAPPTA